MPAGSDQPPRPAAPSVSAAGGPGARSGDAAGQDVAAQIVALEETALRLESLERFRRTFISEASHELNTPLTPLGIHVDALDEMDDLKPHHRQHLAVIQRNLRRLRSLVQGMLETSRLETGRFRLDVDDVPLAVLLSDAVDGLLEVAAAGGVELRLSHVEHLVVRADRERVGQVLHNLVSNALRFTRPGGKVVLDARWAGGKALVRVTDTGPGLTAQQIGQLFQPFSRPIQSPGAAKGTGLGLFISKSIVEQHGGRAWAESDGPGLGASFCFSLPLAVEPRRPAARPALEPPQRERAGPAA